VNYSNRTDNEIRLGADALEGINADSEPSFKVMHYVLTDRRYSLTTHKEVDLSFIAKRWVLL
jgi:hypothetical protein